MSIYAIGVESDPTMRHFLALARQHSTAVAFINLFDLCAAPWHFAVPSHAGNSRVLATQLTLDAASGYYIRLIDFAPVLAAAESAAWRLMLASLSAFLETVSGPVINRPGGQLHNGAKPYHERWLAARGFAVPPALTASSKAALVRFVRQYKGGIVKALSGSRGTAQLVTEKDFETYDPRQGPVHVQQFIQGYDVRAHVIGTEIFSEKIESAAPDYRHTTEKRSYSPTTIPAPLAHRMRAAAAEMQLPFTGWDFKVDAAGQYWCLEVNPMPGYDSYDRRAAGQITAALLRQLVPG